MKDCPVQIFTPDLGSRHGVGSAVSGVELQDCLEWKQMDVPQLSLDES